MPKTTPKSPTAIISIARACRLADCDYRTACQVMGAGLFTPDFIQMNDTGGRAFVFFRDDRLIDLQNAIKKLQSEKLNEKPTA